MILNAKFSGDGTLIIIEFDVQTQKAAFNTSISSCDTLFDINNGETGHSCYWSSDNRKLFISLSAKTTIPIDGTIIAKAGNNIHHKMGNSGEVMISSSIIVSAPPNNEIPTPNVKITDPIQIGICGKLQLSSIVSKTGGRTISSYQWSSIPAINGTDTSIYKNSRLVIPGSLLNPGTTYQFELSAINWFGKQGNSESFSVQVLNDSLVDVSIRGPSIINIRVDQELDISAEIILNKDCIPPGVDITKVDMGYDYTWSIQGHPEIKNNGGKSQRFRVPATSFTPNTYLIDIEIKTKIGVKGFGQVTVIVSSAPIVAIVATVATVVGGSRRSIVVSPNNLIIDASKSCVIQILIQTVLASRIWSCK